MLKVSLSEGEAFPKGGVTRVSPGRGSSPYKGLPTSNRDFGDTENLVTRSEKL